MNRRGHSILFRHCGPQRFGAFANIVSLCVSNHGCDGVRVCLTAFDVFVSNADVCNRARPKVLISAKRQHD
jgi:hypothetical protein